jgi:hypothetical protein
MAAVELTGRSRYENREHERGAVRVPVPASFTDLSTVHSSLGHLSDGGERVDWRGYQLSQEQVEQFWREGYLSNIPVLSEDQCQLLLSDYRTFLDPTTLHDGHGLFYEFHRNQSGEEANVLLHALGQWRMSRAFHDLCFLPQIVSPAAQLVDPSRQPSRLRLWHDQLFAKPPHHGGVVAWHQDYSYWTRTKPMMHVTVDVTEGVCPCQSPTPHSETWSPSSQS